MRRSRARGPRALRPAPTTVARRAQGAGGLAVKGDRVKRRLRSLKAVLAPRSLFGVFGGVRARG